MVPRCISRRWCRILLRICDLRRHCVLSGVSRLQALYRVVVGGRGAHGPRARWHRFAQAETRRLSRRTHGTGHPVAHYSSRTEPENRRQVGRLTTVKTAGAAESKHIPILSVRVRVRLPRSRAAHGHLKFRAPPQRGHARPPARRNRSHLHQLDELRISVKI